MAKAPRLKTGPAPRLRAWSRPDAAQTAKAASCRTKAAGAVALAYSEAFTPLEHTMSISEELNRLHDLHRQGGLSEAEFAQAKARVLNGTDSGSAGGTPLVLVMRVRS